jgi:hypothetical protein
MIFIPEHYRRVQTMEQQEVSNFLGLQSTPFQTSEQGKASYTPEYSHGKKGKEEKGLNKAPKSCLTGKGGGSCLTNEPAT